jgi:hypothetical protein
MRNIFFLLLLQLKIDLYSISLKESLATYLVMYVSTIFSRNRVSYLQLLTQSES